MTERQQGERLTITDREERLTVKQFASLFERNLSGMYRAIHRGTCPDATQIAGRWYIRVNTRDVKAARNRSVSAA